MMRPMMFSAILSPFLLASCATPSAEPEVIVQTKIVAPEISIRPRPRPVKMNDVRFYVVNEDNLEQFIDLIREKEGAAVFVAVTVQGYENLSLNVSELRRYILQQKQIIVYYEQSLREFE